jgi:voltage-gated potassium channel
MTARARLYAALNPIDQPSRLSVVILTLIFVSTATAIAETEATISEAYGSEFRVLELIFGVLFAIEYAARIWCAPESGESRFRYASRPATILDLVVVIGTLMPFVAPSIMVLRLVRVLRMLRLAKVGRYSKAFQMMSRAIHSRASHLWVTLFISGFFLVFSATLMFWIEGGVQPDAFGSIPRAMWWAAVTMTTVGYGDIVPQTAIGKLFGGLISISGIALIAIPTGILASAFSEELSKE